jgi:SAM-dependent methyltransferase
MASPWLDVPLADYEGHMNAPQVAQLGALAELFGEALAHSRPESVTVVGVAGGNGLDRVDQERTRRVVGLDVSLEYLDEAARRYSHLPLELHCIDLARERVAIEPTYLVHAALIFEHAGAELALDNALACLKPGGHFSVVLQLPSATAAGVAPTGFDSLQRLAADFQLFDPVEFTVKLASRGLQLVTETRREVASGKALWMGIFAADE